MVEKKKKTRSTSSSVDPATQYARDVDSGKEIAGPDIRNPVSDISKIWNPAMLAGWYGMLQRRSVPSTFCQSTEAQRW
jgi:hypothetical protein